MLKDVMIILFILLQVDLSEYILVEGIYWFSPSET
jgi:hypothetical protein